MILSIKFNIYYMRNQYRLYKYKFLSGPLEIGRNFVFGCVLVFILLFFRLKSSITNSYPTGRVMDKNKAHSIVIQMTPKTLQKNFMSRKLDLKFIDFILILEIKNFLTNSKNFLQQSLFQFSEKQMRLNMPKKE